MRQTSVCSIRVFYPEVCYEMEEEEEKEEDKENKTTRTLENFRERKEFKRRYLRNG